MMNDYPNLIFGESLREVQELCREFVNNNTINGIERKGQAKWKIKSNGKEYWIMHQIYYEEWCKGRTYYIDGKLYHSNYELKEDEYMVVNDCFWCFINGVCEGVKCNGCKDYIDINSDKGAELMNKYDDDMEEALKPLADKWKKLKEQRNDKT